MSNGRLKAIETRHRGCRFRSRTEARWVVFFDALGIDWRYEPEGYDLDGTPYLPDFWLPGLECWFEVKGGRPATLDLLKCVALGDASGYAVVVAQGSPGDEWLSVYCREGCRCAWRERVQFAIAHGAGPCLCGDDLARYTHPDHPSGDDWGALVSVFESAPDADAIGDAYAAARSARFEHGAKP